MTTMTVQLRRKEVIILPVELRRQNSLDEGDIFTLLDLEDGSFLLTPRVSQVARLGDQVARLMAEEDVDLEAVLETLEQERETYYREHYGQAESLTGQYSALFAGVVSPSGAARALLLLAEAGQLMVTVSEQVVAETERAVARKVSRALPYYRQALRSTCSTSCATPCRRRSKRTETSSPIQQMCPLSYGDESRGGLPGHPQPSALHRRHKCGGQVGVAHRHVGRGFGWMREHS